MDIERILERVGNIQQEVVIDKNFFYCGRMKESDLMCLSLLVSREHCLFTKLADGLYVTDLGSSNGIYINGKIQRSKRQILLREGDLIGIGCEHLTNLDNTMFVYKVKNRVVVPHDCDSSTSNNLSNDRSIRKEQSKHRRSESNDNDAPANKIAKTVDINDDNDDIEIIEFANSCSIATKKSCEMEKKNEPIKQVSKVASTSGRESARQISESTVTASTIESKFNTVIEKNKPTKQSILPDIIDITEPSTSNKVQDDDNNDDDIMEIDFEPPSINIKKEYEHTNLSNKEPGDFDVHTSLNNKEHGDFDVHTNLNNKEQGGFDEFRASINFNQRQQNVLEPSISTIVKTEPEYGSFSQIDIVEINDDDEDGVFPSSQLFDRTVVKEELNEENNDNAPHSSLFLNEEDDNAITILDSDEEDNLIITGNNTMYPIQKIKIEPGLEPTLEFVDVGEIEHNTSDETNNVCQSNEQADSARALIATLTTEQSLEEQLLALHQESRDQPETKPASPDPLISKEVFPSNDTSTENNICAIKDRTISNKVMHPSNDTSTENNISTTKDRSISDKKDNKQSKKRSVELCDPHFIKPKKRSGKTYKEDKKPKRKDRSERKSSTEKRHSTDSAKDSSRKKDGSKDSPKDKKHSKDKDASKHISSSKKNKSDKDKHQSTSSESDSNQETIGLLKNKNDENQNKNLSNSNVVDQSKPKNRTTVVKAKVSARTRGDMLCEAMQELRPKPRKDVKSKASEPVKQKSPPKPTTVSSFTIPRRQTPSSTVSYASSISMTSQVNTPPPATQSKSIPSTLEDHIPSDMDISPSPSPPLSPPPVNDDRRSPSPVSEPTTNYNKESDLCSSNSNLKSALKSINTNTFKKTVIFKDNIAAVREFPIEEGNVMRNIKDGNNLRSGKKDFIGYRTTELKIEDFLARVFAWEPIWLEQQQNIKELPPIVKKEDMQQLPNIFTYFDQYYKRMEVLLLLETWQYLFKEYEGTGNRYTTSKVLQCSIVRHSIKQMVTPNKLRYTMMHINTLVTKNQMRLQEHPVYGDMIIIEYTIKHGTVNQLRRAFAYVVQVQQQNSLKYLRSNQKLCKGAPNADVLLTYVVHTKMIDEQTVQYEQLARLRSIFYIRPHLRLIQGLQYVPHADLCESILNVDIEQFQLESVTSEQMQKYNLVAQEKLNTNQMEAVVKFTEVAVKHESKICLLVGPPGTGKSKVIANLVTQILYGDGRYLREPPRILLCAPSNAAIDEIVIRLLKIRRLIKEHRFKMVRIGRMESMHEDVKPISLAELAKKEVQKNLNGNMNKHTDGVEQEKRALKDSIQALQLLVDNNPKHIGYRLDLDNAKFKYQRLTNRRLEDDAADFAKKENNAKIVILQKANVIACTLSSCYTGLMESIFGGNSHLKIPICIVDEATQCCEAETLIPLMLGIKNLILVGDPNQLPATIMSTDAKKLGLDRSLFTRVKEALEPQINNEMKNRNDPIITLNMQYRMVQAISHWPNNFFYKGKLKDMVDYKNTFPFQSYRVLDIDGMQDNIRFQNTSEATFVGNLIHSLMTCSKISSWNRKITVGIITPYQNQKSVILTTIKDQIKSVPENFKNKFSLEVNTIDSFQGQERDIIIMSLVRTSGIGFLSDPQRLCVALTRAKFTLIICGNFNTFQRDFMWKDLFRDARARGIIARLPATAKAHEIRPHIVRLD